MKPSGFGIIELSKNNHYRRLMLWITV